MTDPPSRPPALNVASPDRGRRWAVLWLWQAPTTVLCLVLVSMTRLAAPDESNRTAFIGLGLVGCVTVAAAAIPWGRLLRGWPAVLACLDLVAAALVNVDAHTVLPANVVLCGLPLVWLSVNWEWYAALTAVIGTYLVVAVPFLFGARWPSNMDGWFDFVLIPLALTGLAVVTQVVRRALVTARRDTMRQAVEARMYASTMNAVLGSVDACVSVHIPGNKPVRNTNATDLCRRGGIDPNGPFAPGPHFYGEDRVTRTPDEQQVPIRAANGDEFSGVLQWVGPPGDQVAMVCGARQLEAFDGQGPGFVIVAWDATELVESIRVRDEFLMTVSHELRTPMTSIAGYLELLDDAIADAWTDDDDNIRSQAQHMLDVARRSTALLGDRIEQLLTITVGHPGLSSLHTVDVTELTRASVAKHDLTATRNGLYLTFSGTVPVDADVDPVAYEQIVDNLVTNAIKYTERGAVTVSVEPTPMRARHRRPSFTLTVQDTGIGMNPNQQRHAFDRFYRADTATRSLVPGIGLGLAITRRLVDLHNGTIELDSTPGHGTTVTITIPTSHDT